MNVSGLKKREKKANERVSFEEEAEERERVRCVAAVEDSLFFNRPKRVCVRASGKRERDRDREKREKQGERKEREKVPKVRERIVSVSVCDRESGREGERRPDGGE